MREPGPSILKPSVYVTVWGGPPGDRSPKEVEVVKSNSKSMWVRLPDGNIVKRKRGRDY